MTITPGDSSIGVTLNIDNFYKAIENGADMSEVVSKATEVAINGMENTPQLDVASLTDYDQMKDKLNYSHVEYVINCLGKNTTKVRNIKSYLLASLFNAGSTISSYYRAEVNHDMPQFAG